MEAYCAEPDAETRVATLLPALKGLSDWADDPQRLRRLTHAEARRTIEALDEVQLVVESILSDEWENWGNPRRYRDAKRKPEQSVPVASVYGGTAALMEQTQSFEKEHGLRRFEDAWCVDSGEPKGGGRREQ